MAAVPRNASSAEPTAWSPAGATGIDRVPPSLRGDYVSEVGYLGSITPTAHHYDPAGGSILTGQAVMVRGGTPPPESVVSAAALAGATQRVDQAGLTSDYIADVSDYFRRTGSYPDLSSVKDAEDKQAPGANAVGGGTWLWVAAGLGALLALYLLTSKKGK